MRVEINFFVENILANHCVYTPAKYRDYWTKIENDKRITALEKSKTSDDEKMKKMENRLKKLEDKMDKVEKDGSTDNSDKVLEEITAISSKDRNLVLQKCEETKEGDTEKADMAGVQGLFDLLDVRMEAKNVLVGTRRLGEKRGDKMMIKKR